MRHVQEVEAEFLQAHNKHTKLPLKIVAVMQLSPAGSYVRNAGKCNGAVATLSLFASCWEVAKALSLSHLIPPRSVTCGSNKGAPNSLACAATSCASCTAKGPAGGLSHKE